MSCPFIFVLLLTLEYKLYQSSGPGSAACPRRLKETALGLTALLSELVGRWPAGWFGEGHSGSSQLSHPRRVPPHLPSQSTRSPWRLGARNRSRGDREQGPANQARLPNLRAQSSGRRFRKCRWDPGGPGVAAAWHSPTHSRPGGLPPTPPWDLGQPESRLRLPHSRLPGLFAGFPDNSP